MTSRSLKFVRRVSVAAPAISLAIALVVPLVLANDSGNAPVYGPERDRVIAAVEGLPYRIGSWAGIDVPMPESAVRLLRPNATVSRSYRNLETGISVELVFVHCGDSRDMLGHFPPVCYPNAGWVLVNGDGGRRELSGTTIELTLDGRRFDAQMYEFTRMETWTNESRIRVFNFFVLPDGRLTNDIDDVRGRSSRLGAFVQGVGQTQLLIDDSVPLDDAIAAANEILAGSAALFAELGVRLYE